MFIQIKTKKSKALKKHLVEAMNDEKSKWIGQRFAGGVFFTHKSRQYSEKSYFYFEDLEDELLVAFDGEYDDFEINSIYTGKIVAFILLNANSMVDDINIIECKVAN